MKTMQHLSKLALILVLGAWVALHPSLAAAQPDDGGWADAQADDGYDDDPDGYYEDGYYDEDLAADADPEALTTFRPRLAPYGTWMDHPTYGTVWVPSAEQVGPDFAPYVTAGRWDLTPEGDWLWVSDYEWGYIPFHYGRWVWISGVGWSWIPGRVYAPAWVIWRTGADGYIGWAPYPPSFYWMGGVAFSLWFQPHAAYVFCPSGYVFHRQVHTHIVRTPADVRRAAMSTAPYRNPGRRAYRPASPSFKASGVPRAAIPKGRSAGDPRALELARGTRSAADPSARGTSASARGASPSTRPQASGSQRSMSRPSAGSTPRPSGTSPRLSQSKTLGQSSGPSRGSFSSTNPSTSSPSRVRSAGPALRNATPGRGTPLPSAGASRSVPRASTSLGASRSQPPSSQRRATQAPATAPRSSSPAPSRPTRPSVSAPSRPSAPSSPSRSSGGGGRRR